MISGARLIHRVALRGRLYGAVPSAGPLAAPTLVPDHSPDPRVRQELGHHILGPQPTPCAPCGVLVKEVPAARQLERVDLVRETKEDPRLRASPPYLVLVHLGALKAST